MEEEFVLLIVGGIALVVVLVVGLWLNTKFKPKSPAKAKATAKSRKKAKGRKPDKFFQDSGRVPDEEGGAWEDSNLYNMKEDKQRLFKGDDETKDDDQLESWDKYG